MRDKQGQYNFENSDLMQTETGEFNADDTGLILGNRETITKKKVEVLEKNYSSIIVKMWSK